MLPKFNQTSKTCRRKLNQISVFYKEDKLANDISYNNRHECNFTTLDQWYHQAGRIFKHVSTTTDDSVDFSTNYFPEVENASIFTPPSIFTFPSILKTKDNF